MQHHHHARPADGSRLWQDADGVHLDLRGLPPPQPMLQVLATIAAGEAGALLVGHFDEEPITLYPELEERGWSHEVMDSHCGSADCENGFMLRMARWG